MKVYYIFNLKPEFVALYKDNARVLFNILRSIYYLDKEEVTYGYNLFSQLIVPFQKNKLDRELYINLHQNIPYSKRKDVHYINDLYKDEVSRLTINNFYLKLELDQNYSSFFSLINSKFTNLFVCNFKTIDYFFLDEHLRRQKELV